jgi:hypothetical protein
MPRLSTEKRQKDQSNNSQSQHMILVRYHNKKTAAKNFTAVFNKYAFLS